MVLIIYRIAQNSGEEKLWRISNFQLWRGKHWRMLDPVVLAGRTLWHADSKAFKRRMISHYIIYTEFQHILPF